MRDKRASDQAVGDDTTTPVNKRSDFSQNLGFCCGPKGRHRRATSSSTIRSSDFERGSTITRRVPRDEGRPSTSTRT